MYIIDEKELKASRIYYESKIPNIVMVSFLTISLIIIISVCFIFIAPYNVVLKTKCELKFKNDVLTIKPMISGPITFKGFQNGQKVNKGDILYMIDNSYYESEFENIDYEISEITKNIKNKEVILEELNLYKKNQKFIHSNNYEIKLILNEIKKLFLEYEYLKEIYLSNLAQYPSSISTIKLKELEQAMYKAEILLENQIAIQEKNIVESIDSYKKLLNEYKLKKSKLEYQYEQTIIRSPIDGYVEEIINISVGEILFSETFIAKIIPCDIENLRVVFYISQNEIAEINKGMEFNISFSKYPVTQYTTLKGHIEYISRDVIFNEDGFYTYKVDGIINSNTIKNYLTENKINLISGMIGEGKILIKTEPLYLYLLKQIGII